MTMKKPQIVPAIPSVLRWLWVVVVAAACSGNAKAPSPAAPVPPRPAPDATAPVLKLGVIVTQRGSLGQYSEAVLDGIRIAAAQHDSTRAHRVELLIRDDSGRVARSAAMMRELEAAGAVAIIGPMYDDGVTAALDARVAPDLLLIAPAYTEVLRKPNAWALNREDSAGAVLLGRHAAASGMRVGILHGRSPAVGRDVAAFVAAYTAGGGAAPTVVPFNAGTTTFAAQIRRLRDARVQMLFLPLTPREIQQVLPQFGYYGLNLVQILGGEAWTSEAMRRALPAVLLEGAVAATVLPRASDDVAWEPFEAAYQQTYKRSLPSPIPALGYDAARLVLDAAPRGRVNARDVSRAFVRTTSVKGATGVMHIRPGAVSRTPFLVRFRDGAWVRVASPGAP